MSKFVHQTAQKLLRKSKSLQIASMIRAAELICKNSITVEEIDLPKKVDGVWITNKRASENLVFINTHVEPNKKTHVTLHELGHILLGHETVDTSDIENSTIEAIVGSAAAKRSLAKEQETVPEREAELFALLIRERMNEESRLNNNENNKVQKMMSFLN